MRRLLPTVRSFLCHSSQVVGLAAVAALAMAFAPLPEPAPDMDVFAAPEAPPLEATVEAAGPIMRELAFGRPLQGYEVNSAFGMRRLAGQSARRHEGVDIAAPQGTTVFSAAEGRVIRTGYDAQGYGRFVEVRHPNGMTTLYGHLSRIDVATGDALGEGERLGLVGSTGRSTGPHLHFEVRRAERHIDPAKVMGQIFEVAVADTAG